MKIPWKHKTCVLCLESAALTKEHVVPASLGGALQVRFLCRRCNSTLGHEWEATAREDASIRLAVENLAHEIPRIADRFAEGQWFVGRSHEGQVRGRMKKGEFRVQTRRLAGDSMIHPTRDARRHLRRHLEELGASPGRVRELLETFDASPEDVYVPLAPGLTVVKWSVDGLKPVLGGNRLRDSVVLKMAYEYIALHLGGAVYQRSPQLDRLREMVLRGEQGGRAYRIEHLSTRKYVALHGLSLEAPSPYSVVRICLFGWLVYRAHLLELAIQGPRLIYEHDLKSSHETLRHAA